MAHAGFRPANAWIPAQPSKAALQAPIKRGSLRYHVKTQHRQSVLCRYESRLFRQCWPGRASCLTGTSSTKTDAGGAPGSMHSRRLPALYSVCLCALAAGVLSEIDSDKQSYWRDLERRMLTIDHGPPPAHWFSAIYQDLSPWEPSGISLRQESQ